MSNDNDLQGFTVPSGFESAGNEDSAIPLQNHDAIRDGLVVVDEEAPPALPQEQSSSKRPRKNVPLTKRIGELTYRHKLVEEQALLERGRYQNEIAELRNQLAQKDQEAKYQEHKQLETTGEALEQSAAVVLNEMRRAEEDGRNDEKIHWQDELRKITLAQAELNVERKQRAAAPAEDEYTYEPLPYYPQAIPQQPVAPPITNPHMVAWLEENEWAHPNSDKYSPMAMNTAQQVAEVLNNHYTMRGEPEKIGSPEYFHIITSEVETAFGARQPVQAPPPSNYPMPAPQQTSRYPTSTAPVSPVPQGGSSMAEAYLRNNQTHLQGASIRLSPPADAVAVNLGFKHPDGRPYTAQENRMEYIRGINAAPAAGKSPFGATQYGFRVPTDGGSR